MSIRLGDADAEHLRSHAQRRGVPAEQLARRYVEEGLRVEAHPSVRFADGPAGRRARLAGTGLDVWEVIATLRDNDSDLGAAAEYLGVSLALVRAAASYYGAYPDEIDTWITANDREANGAGIRPANALAEEARRIGNDPTDRAEMQAVREDMDGIAADRPPDGPEGRNRS